MMPYAAYRAVSTVTEYLQEEVGTDLEEALGLDRLGMYQQLGAVPPTPELRKQAGLET
jgi:hypothetical protein